MKSPPCILALLPHIMLNSEVRLGKKLTNAHDRGWYKPDGWYTSVHAVVEQIEKLYAIRFYLQESIEAQI